MLRVSARVNRVKITEARDLEGLRPAGECAVDPWAISRCREVFDRFCRSLGAHLGATVEDRAPRPEDGAPGLLDRVIDDIRAAGYEVWAVRLDLDPLADGSNPAGDAPPGPMRSGSARTRFFITPTRRRGQVPPRTIGPEWAT